MYMIAQDKGFRSSVQSLIDIGARHGSLRIEDLLYNHTTLAVNY